MVFSGYYGKDTMGNSPRNRFHTDNRTASLSNISMRPTRS
jgi:hypothetical protein